MNIIPLPNNYKQRFGVFSINENSKINYSKEFILSTTALTSFIKSKTKLTILQSENSNINFLLNIELPSEGYILDINENELNIHARSDRGAFYAVQSLKQLFYFSDNQFCVNCIYIEDYPRFPYRGFMLDIARNFFNKDVVFKIIDMLALQKFNYLHLHLSDDQGFRLQIDKYPLLTEIGANYKGFYTREDIKDIVRYAQDNFIEVIPEIDLPGHTSAIIASYPNLSCNNEKIEVEKKYGIIRRAICVSKNDTYEFVENILYEIMELFPSKYIHIGVDEVSTKNWKKCSSCRALLKQENLKSYKDLARLFANNIASFLRENSKIPIAWNDLINYSSNYNIILQHWKPFTNKKSIKEINEGRKAIISNFFYYYLDYPYSMTPLKKTYNFNPILKGVTKKDNIIGIEAPVWTEYIKNENKLQEKIYPRLAAISEAGWTNHQSKNYEDFIKRLKEFLKLFSTQGIYYFEDYDKKEGLIKRVIKTSKWVFKNILKN